jgi:hypothetical protein
MTMTVDDLVEGLNMSVDRYFAGSDPRLEAL